ncbi:MAG: hypothetical protein U0183_11415 [Polyangiaceae bacterium]
MSYTMSVSLVGPLDAVATVEALGDDVKCREDLVAGEWPDRAIHVYRVGRSTRGVELLRHGDELGVRMVACANDADWALAFALLELLNASPITGEDGTCVALADVRSGFAEVVARETAAAISTLHALVDQGEEIELEGVTRTVHFGSRMLSDIGREPGALLERIRRIQYIVDEGFEPVAPEDLGAMLGLSEPLELSMWDPDVAQVFAPTSLVALRTPTLYVPMDALPAVGGPHFEWLDERQFTIAVIPADERPALVERATREAVDPYAKLRAHEAKKWWQFWR